MDFAELTALYTLADVCFVTSLRDGMNLVSLEYIVCQGAKMASKEGPGVLILSEFAGVSIYFSFSKYSLSLLVFFPLFLLIFIQISD